LLAVFLSLAVVFWLKTDAVHPDFQTVTVNIKSVYNARFGNNVYVIYENKEYPLINVIDSELPKYKVHCKNGMPVEVLLGSDGKFYSNINGIKTNTSTGKWYFVFLGGTLASIMIFAVFMACVAEAKKREKGIYPERGF